MQRGVVVANTIEQSDELLDVARPVPIAGLYLVFLRIQVLLSSGYRSILAQFVATIYSIRRRQRRGQHQSHREGRAPAGLQNIGKNIRSVSKEIRPEIFSRLAVS